MKPFLSFLAVMTVDFGAFTFSFPESLIPFVVILTRPRAYTEEWTWQTCWSSFLYVYLFSDLCVKHIGMQAEEDISLSCCCQLTTEAREISKGGKPHVHCPCDKCSGKATWPLTAWRYFNSECELSSQPTTVKKKSCKTLEELELITLELPVEYEELLCTYSEFPPPSDVCAEVNRAGHDHDDISFTVFLSRQWWVKYNSFGFHVLEGALYTDGSLPKVVVATDVTLVFLFCRRWWVMPKSFGFDALNGRLHTCGSLAKIVGIVIIITVGFLFSRWWRVNNDSLSLYIIEGPLPSCILTKVVFITVKIAIILRFLCVRGG